MLNVRVFDRTKLILEIFENSAHTAEGKTQVSVAMLQYKKSRLAGKGIHLSQQRGVIGVRGGFGETAKEKETRDIDNQILKLKKNLKKLFCWHRWETVAVFRSAVITDYCIIQQHCIKCRKSRKKFI